MQMFSLAVINLERGATAGSHTEIQETEKNSYLLQPLSSPRISLLQFLNGEREGERGHLWESKGFL